ncbi:HI1506-related protein [Aquitalea pelogenes]|uniref:HI1506-related protein n=1 Tax=Aquitalea pelogenes TaxID=1293573 RepID=UPI00128F9462|nr:HI1506-related protein [Aquitalea pelogenes]
MIRITARDDGFRRAGMAHSATPTEHPDETFTPEQLQELQAEPLLVVEVLPDPATTAKANSKAKGAS